MEDSVRVLIAEDHPLFREGMRGRLERVADIAVVGEAASCRLQTGRRLSSAPATPGWDLRKIVKSD